MSRAVVWDVITTDATLNLAGIDADSVKVNYDGDNRPSDKMFVVLRWGTTEYLLSGDDGSNRRGAATDLSVWVHMYQEFSTDFGRIDAVIARLDDLLTNIIDMPGDDGRTLVMVEPEGHSGDLRDVTYETFCRETSYKVLSRTT